MKKISHDEFVAALARLLKADAVIIDSRLEDFLESLKAELKEKGSVFIDDLGTFTMVEDKLVFDPDETLALEINYKYAGMEAIEIMPAYAKKIKPDAGKAIDDTDGKKKPLIPKQSSKKTGELEKVKDAGEKDTQTSKLSEPVSATKDETKQKFQSEDVVEKEETKEEDPFNLKDYQESGDSATAKEKGTPDLVKQENRPSGSDETEKESSETTEINSGYEIEEEDQEAVNKKPNGKAVTYTLIVMAAALLIGLFVYQAEIDIPFEIPLDLAGNQGIHQTQVIILPEMEADEQPGQSESGLSQTGPSGFEEEFMEEIEADVATVGMAYPDNDSTYGLYGSLTDIARSFTIVVHSLPYRQASSERDKLQQAGFRAVLDRVNLENDRETWRVGIGQFETMDDASKAIQELDEPYRSNNFVARIRNQR